MSDKLPDKPATTAEITQFIAEVKKRKAHPATGVGRLLFAIDATASRQASWDRASHLQAKMFQAVQNVGGLSVQLCYFRGFGEFKASSWHSNSKALLRSMTGVQCRAGHTQIGRVLKHALAEQQKLPVNAVVFIGDACEEPAKPLLDLAGKLAVHKVPVFIFQEGSDRRTANVFEQIAKLSGGAYCRFDSNSASLLAELLAAVAVYATGGKSALLENISSKPQLLEHFTRQLK